MASVYFTIITILITWSVSDAAPVDSMFHGIYPGECKKDGYYYSGERSYTVCTNGLPYQLPCAPGSRNSPFLQSDVIIGSRAFCDVNEISELFSKAGSTSPTGVTTSPNQSGNQPANQIQRFKGVFNGFCNGDGLYYSSIMSFVECSNGIAYEVHCGPGSQNRMLEQYNNDEAFTFQSFCDIPSNSLGNANLNAKSGGGFDGQPIATQANRLSQAVTQSPKGLNYLGAFTGSCTDVDGFYYYSILSFVECSQGRPFEVYCADGSQNKPLATFSEPGFYPTFCDVITINSKSQATTPVPSLTNGPTTGANNGDRFNGMFSGACGADGFYYKSLLSFVECASGAAYEVTCAPGSQNRPFSTFTPGVTMDYLSFCNVISVGGNLGGNQNQPGQSSHIPTTMTQHQTTDGIQYRGYFPGSCNLDGFYYYSKLSFYECANGEAFQVPCPSGTENSPISSFSMGVTMDYSMFCSVHSGSQKNSAGTVVNPGPDSNQAGSSSSYVGLHDVNFPCPQDGLYYSTMKSFVECNNGMPFEVHCAPGTENRPFETFNRQISSGFTNFCDTFTNDIGKGNNNNNVVTGGGAGNNQGTNNAGMSNGHNINNAGGNGGDSGTDGGPKYLGLWQEVCSENGYYYSTLRSYVVCNHGEAYEQPCSPGTRNAMFESFVVGQTYEMNSFCNIFDGTKQ